MIKAERITHDSIEFTKDDGINVLLYTADEREIIRLKRVLQWLEIDFVDKYVRKESRESEVDQSWKEFQK